MAPRKLTPRQQELKETRHQIALVKARQKTSSHRGKVRRLTSGLLDVDRKGKYTKLIRENSESSALLQLPPEIRRRIFEYAVGGKTFCVRSNYNDGANGPLFHTSVSNKEKNNLSLLQVCRQIYSETVILPFRTNIFSFMEPRAFPLWLGNRLPIEREAITTIEFQLRWNTIHYYATLSQNGRDYLSFGELPNLKKVHVISWKPEDTSGAWDQQRVSTEDLAQFQKKIVDHNQGVNLNVDVTLKYYSELHAVWYLPYH